MLLYFTEEEKAIRHELFEKYFTEKQKIEKRLAKYGHADTEPLFEKINALDNPEEWQAALDKEADIIKKWEQTKKYEKWTEILKSLQDLESKYDHDINKFFIQCEKDHFAALGGQLDAVIANFKEQVTALINNYYEVEQELYNKAGPTGKRISTLSFPVGNSQFLLNPQAVSRRLKQSLHLHYKFVKDNEEITELFNAYISEQLDESPLVYHGKITEKMKKFDYSELDSSYDIFFDPVEKVSALYATDLTINLTKAARGISEITEFGDTHGYIVSPTSKRKSKKKADSITYLTLTPTDENNNLTFSRPITLYDRGIIDNIEALANHNTHITATEVYRQMNGGSNLTVEKGTITDIESRIDYMRRIMVTVDYTQHMNMNGHPGIYKIEGALLKLDKVTFSLNGRTVTGYRYNAPSPLFEYAKAVEQLATIPVIMLETKSIQKNSVRAESIKQYLLFRLYTMEHQGETISLETILKEIGEPEPTPQQLRAIRNIIENFLEYWSFGKLRADNKPANKEILNISPIRGYNVNTVGKKVTGYTVTPKVITIKKEGVAVTQQISSRNPTNK